MVALDCFWTWTDCLWHTYIVMCLSVMSLYSSIGGAKEGSLSACCSATSSHTFSRRAPSYWSLSFYRSVHVVEESPVCAHPSAVRSSHVHYNCLTTCLVHEGHVVSFMCVDLFKVTHVMSAAFSASVVRLTCSGIM